MFFRNCTLFRFPAGIEQRFSVLEDALREHQLRPCGPLELQTRGWVSPYGRGEEMMAVRQGHIALLALGGEDKILPTAVINQHIAEKVEQLEKERGRPVGARERRKLKDDATTELLPRALARPSRLAGYLDLDNGWVVVDSSSRKAAEGFVSAIRTALGSFPATGIEPEESPRAILTEWLIAQKAADGFALGDECELKDPADKGAVVRCRRQDLTADEMREHLTAGKQCTQLAMTFSERISFVLDESLTIRKFKLLDIATEQLDKGDRDSAKAELDARLILLAGEIATLLAAIERVFGVHRPQSL